uniref:Tripartite motif-containing protein 5-like n=1 Tax=Crassostrea virginica TaxID=6565 RepID=A0A8B8DQG8_CRAVI|nr:tripartite motif-containing protein 5-like [Crassostrea virginica]
MATASKLEHNLINEVNLCSICLEQYKLPVTLPCNHSFCQTCLEAHIKSSCVNLDPPLGFPCPLCRVFIPAPGRIGQYSLDLWSTKFPENKLLSSVIEKGLLYCKPCQRDEEEIIADRWCQDCSEALCNTCEKYHKKLRPTSHHVVVSVTDLSVSTKTPFLQSLEICEAHDGRKLELFCKKHFQPCCAVCVAQNHNNCYGLCQLENADENYGGSKMKECLKSEVEKIRSTIEQTIQEEKANLGTIDDVTEKFSNELSEISDDIIKAVQRLKEKHFDELAKLSKKSKSKLQRSVDSMEQRLQYLLYWNEVLMEKVSEQEITETRRVLYCSRMKKICEDLQNLSYSKLEIHIQAKLLVNAQKLKNFTCLAELTSNEHLKPVNVRPEKINFGTATIKTESGLKIPVIGTFYGGDFLSNGKQLLADNKNKKNILLEVDCGLTVLQEKKLSGSPYGVCAIGENEVLVTLSHEKKVLRLDTDSLEIKETISLECRCFGIATSGNITVIGTRDSVVTFSGGLEKRRSATLSSDLSSTDDVALDDENNVIYSSYSQHTVRKQDKAGNVLFSYTHEKLKSPYGLDVNRNGEIFVVGYKSNNIHILSRSGELLRILEGIKNPTWVKFQSDTSRLFVMESGSQNLKVYQFTAL